MFHFALCRGIFLVGPSEADDLSGEKKAVDRETHRIKESIN
jgi:hypothetical protein